VLQQDNDPGNFLARLYGPTTTGRLWLSNLPNTPGGKPGERRLLTRDIADIRTFVARHDQPGRATYFCASPIRAGETWRNKHTVGELALLHADLDCKSIVEDPDAIRRVLAQLPLQPTAIVYSGHGYHVYFGLTEALEATAETIARVEGLNRKLAAVLAGDAVYDVSRLMRLPGSTNSKDPDAPVKVEVVDCDPTRRHELSDLIDWLGEARSLLQSRGSQKGAADQRRPDANPFEALAAETNEHVDCEARLAAMRFEGPGNSAIHLTQRAVVDSMLSSGRTFDETVATVLARTKEVAAEVGWDWGREEEKIRGLAAGWLNLHPELRATALPEQTARLAAGKYRIFRHGDEEADDDLRWLVENLIPESGDGLLSGQSGTFKTFTALDLAGAVMTAKAFIDYPVLRKGGVLYFAGEGGGGIRRRLQAMLDVKHPEVESAPFFWLRDYPQLLKPGSAAVIVEIAKEVAAEMQRDFGLPLVLIVFDTVTSSAGYREKGDEDDTVITQRVHNVFKAITTNTGAFVLGLDHYGKMLETGTRGSSNKEAGADLVLSTLANKSPTNSEITNLRLAVRKVRDAETGREIPFEMSRSGPATSSLLVNWKPEGKPQPPDKAKADGWPEALQMFRLCLQLTLDRCGTLHRPGADWPTVRAVDLEQVRQLFYQKYASKGDTPQKQAAARQKKFVRDVNAAQTHNLITVLADGDRKLVWFAKIVDEAPHPQARATNGGGPGTPRPDASQPEPLF
jgi:hypothetical protein